MKIKRTRVTFDIIHTDNINPHKWNWVDVLGLETGECLSNLSISTEQTTDKDIEIFNEEWNDCYCIKCHRQYTSDDIDGSRCLGCGTMIVGEKI